MSCTVTVGWKCEVCKCQIIDEFVSNMYSDPVLTPPAGWDYGKDGETLMCSVCLAKDKNSVKRAT